MRFQDLWDSCGTHGVLSMCILFVLCWATRGGRLHHAEALQHIYLECEGPKAGQRLSLSMLCHIPHSKFAADWRPLCSCTEA